jgi:hypothetical protein
MDAEGELHRRVLCVGTAARLANGMYDEGVPDAHGLTRVEYVGRAAVKALYSDVGNGRPPNARAVDEGR